jgi:hypothetical protein
MHFPEQRANKIKENKKPRNQGSNLKKLNGFCREKKRERIVEDWEKGSCLWPPPHLHNRPNPTVKERALGNPNSAASTTDGMYSLSLPPQKPHSFSLQVALPCECLCHLICTLKNNFSLKKCFIFYGVSFWHPIWVMGF